MRIPDVPVRGGQIVLGQLIALLAAAHAETPKATLEFDFPGLLPDHLRSWRGSYAELAVGYKERKEFEEVKVSDFLLECENAVGQSYSGWKGGLYKMGLTTPIWVANSGESSHGIVTGVMLDRGSEIVHLTTSVARYF